MTKRFKFEKPKRFKKYDVYNEAFQSDYHCRTEYLTMSGATFDMLDEQVGRAFTNYYTDPETMFKGFGIVTLEEIFNEVKKSNPQITDDKALKAVFMQCAMKIARRKIREVEWLLSRAVNEYE